MRAVLLSVLMMVSVVSEAEWTQVGGNSDGKELFSDFSTLKKTKEGYVRVWELMSNDKKNPLGFKSFKTLRLYDCEQERARSLKAVFFDGEQGQGQVVKLLDDNGKWSFVAPDSVSEAAMKEACSRR